MIEPEIIAKIKQLITQIKATGKKFVIIHYTGVNADTSAASISWYHKIFLKWKRDGYHNLLNTDGKIEDLEPVWARVNGCLATGWFKNSNEYYIGKNAYQIVFETLAKLEMSDKQNEVLIYFLKELVKVCPDIQIGGHREYPDLTAPNKRQQTQCPGFSVSDWLLANGIPKRNVFYEVWKP